MTMADFRAVVDVHLVGSAHASKAVWPVMRAQGYGRILMTTSTSGMYGNFGQANYSAAKLGIAALSKSIALDMGRFGVRSNCIAPFAWSRMTSSIPADTPEQQARVAKLQQMTPDKNAPLAVFLASDAASGFTGQVFATRYNEIFLMSQSRPLRSVHRAEGWTPALIAEHAWEDIDGPVVRVATPDVPIPFSPTLEQAVLPQVDDVREAVRELLDF